MNKKISMFILLVFLLGLVSAHERYYNLDSGDDFISKKKVTKSYYPNEIKIIQIISLNEKRRPVYEYRHGYTYRITEEFKGFYEKRIREIEKKRIHDEYYIQKDFFNEEDGKNRDYYYKFIPHKKKTVAISCYKIAPKGKLFYRRCP